ncbi:hypothetical protein N665_0366s0014 [Sinapis alba]|nr:hypothetical protein N665_0366s0014 [Sinapis alba]
MHDFLNCTTDSYLSDMDFCGNDFTWSLYVVEQSRSSCGLQEARPYPTSIIIPLPEAGVNERNTYDKWAKLARAEESFFHQLSHITWLDKGDENTTSYHRQVRTRISQNQIIFMQDEMGNVLDSKEDVMNHVVGYYESLLGGMSTDTASSLDGLSNLISFRCSSELRETLESPISNMDIQSAFFSLQKNKAPGPDEYPAEFFTHHWKTRQQRYL